MALSHEEIERIQETERIKLQAKAKFEEEQQELRDAKDLERSKKRAGEIMGNYLDGGPAGDCPTCGDELRGRWRYCPTCGTQVLQNCQWCQELLPQRAALHFCPHCGKAI